MAMSPMNRSGFDPCPARSARNRGIFSANRKYGTPSMTKARPRAVTKSEELNCIDNMVAGLHPIVYQRRNR